MNVWFLVAIAAFAIRCVLVGTPGFPTDVSAFASWMHAMVDIGPHGIYLDQSNRTFPAVDYPPGYLYVLWAMGALERLIFGIQPSALVDRVFVKLPAMLADFAAAFAIADIVRGLNGEKAALRSFALLLLAPMLWFISAVWGQVDIVAALFLVLSVRCALRAQFVPMWILLAVAISIKPQPAVTIPLFFIYQAFQGRKPLGLLTGPLAAVATAYFIALPAAPGIRPDVALRWLFERYTFGIAKYPNGSSGAFNVYTVFGNAYEPDTLRILGVPLHTLGTAATLIIVGACAVFLATRLRMLTVRNDILDPKRSAALALVGTMVIALFGLFLGMTRMHERYEMSALVLLPIIAAVGRTEMLIAGIFWLNFCINAAFIIVGFYGGHHHPQVKLIVHFISVANIIAFTALIARVLKPPATRARAVTHGIIDSVTTSTMTTPNKVLQSPNV